MTATQYAELVYSVIVIVLVGYVTTDILAGKTLPLSLRSAISPGIGAGISSLIFFVFRRPIFTVEALILIIIIPIWFFLRRAPIRGSALVVDKVHRVSLIVCLCGCVLLGLALSAMLIRVSSVPHGDWDGWAIWNSHARFLFRNGPGWQDQISRRFQGIQNTFHPDYPLLTPTLTARFWRYADVEIPEVGGLINIAFGVSIIAVLLTGLTAVRDLSLGAVTALVLIGTPFYLYHCTSQYADLALAFYFLVPVVLLCVQDVDRSSNSGLMSLVGFAAGCAGWTKNEGLVFIAALSTVLIVIGVRRRSTTSLRRISAFGAGLFLPAMIILYFKLWIASENDLIFNRGTGAVLIQKMFDPARYISIIQAFCKALASWWITPSVILLVTLVLSRGLDRARLKSFGLLAGICTFTLLWAAYFGIYVLTPLNLQYHLNTSLDRLLLQLYPSVLFLTAFLAAGLKEADVPHSK